MSRAISSRKATDASGCLIAFFAIFAVVGLFAFASLFLVPCINVLRAKSWTPTPCKIQSSAVASRGSGKDLRYYPDVLFAYSIGGQSYDSTNYSFFKLGFQNTYDPQSLLNPYPAGTTATCYVNPGNPAQAVLNRDFQTAALPNLLTLLFLLVGVGGIIWQVRSRRLAGRNEGLGRKSWQPKNVPASAVVPTAVSTSAGTAFSTPTGLTGAQSTAAASWQPGEIAPTSGIAGKVTLKPVTTPAGQTCGLLFITLFWNGIVAVFLRAMFFEMSGAGFMRVFLGLFLIPFVIIGLVLIVAVLASLGAMFVPRPVLMANTATIPLGGTLELQWQTRRGLLNPQKLQIRLEAREEATYTRGTNSYTDKNIFISRPVFESAPGGVQSGQSSVAIPAEAMHSFEAPRNKILWAIKVKGDVPLWPNFEDEYRLVVLPTAADTQISAGAQASVTPNATQSLSM